MKKTARAKTKKKTAAKPGKGSAPVSAKWVGQPIQRKEEDRLVRGKGIFVDDQKLTGMLHICFVRSTYAHARTGAPDAFTQREQWQYITSNTRSIS